MIHPLLLAIALLDTLALALLLQVGWGAVRILGAWAPESADRRQLRLEARADTASIAIGWALASSLAASVGLLAAVALLLPPLLPGAMCGTGVVQASGGKLSGALLLRTLLLGLFHAWRVLQRLDRGRPEAPLTLPLARLALVLLPAAATAGWETFSALSQLDTHTPVSCCAVVYAAARTAAAPGGAIPARGVLWSTALGGLAICVLALSIARSGAQRAPCVALGLLLLGWPPLAGAVHIRFLAPYVYGVLHHHCPWCLMLPVHGGIGLPLLCLLAGMSLEGLAAAVSAAAAERFAALRMAAERRARRAARRTVALMALFFLAALLPALVWRWRSGAWL